MNRSQFIIIATLETLTAGVQVAKAQTTTNEWVQPQDEETCAHQPQVAWCDQPSNTLPPKLALPQHNLQAVRRIEAQIRRQFTLTNMGDERDLWRSYVDPTSGPMNDDCTGLASTVVDALARQGYQTSRALVITRFRGRPDHMVGLVTINGTQYVVGDTLREEPYLYADARFIYTFASISKTERNAKWVSAR